MAYAPLEYGYKEEEEDIFFCSERFPFSKIQKKSFWREKNQLSKKVGPNVFGNTPR
jgi:hypothetical protein